MFLFGLVTMLQGFVTNYGGLLATRFFLGVFESGMFPGCTQTLHLARDGISGALRSIADRFDRLLPYEHVVQTY